MPQFPGEVTGMGFYLNNSEPYSMYQEMVRNPYFVDKTQMIDEMIPRIGITEKYICVTRPRRFGKTVMASMLGAFFSKACDSGDLFDKLHISQSPAYERHRNQYNVIYIDFSAVGDFDSYSQYISEIQTILKGDLRGEYETVPFRANASLFEDLKWISLETGEKFIFILDEWDSIFHKDFISERDKKEYLNFLRLLLKGRTYVSLAYMTGILPISKYSSGSGLNMFLEYNMATEKTFDSYFGFTEKEVDVLYETYRKNRTDAGVTRQGLKEWYDGYHTRSGERLYNPRSVVAALTNDNLGNYWTSSGPYDEIFYYIRNNIQDVRDDIVLMVSGETVPIALQGYAVTGTELKTKNQIYSAMVVYGLLTYENKKVSIPNKELMDKFNELLLNNDCLGYVYSLARESERMLAATLAGDTNTMADILEYAHNTESPIFSYHSEIELAAVVNLVYLAARDRYRVEREDKAGKGYVDFIFYPEVKSADALILELKVGSTPKKAIQQIKDKNYVLRLRGKLGEEPKYTGKVLAVGISYSKKTKKHVCKVEVL